MSKDSSTAASLVPPSYCSYMFFSFLLLPAYLVPTPITVRPFYDPLKLIDGAENHPTGFAVLVFYHIRKPEWTSEGSDKLQKQHIGSQRSGAGREVGILVARQHVFLAAVPRAVERTKQLTATTKGFSLSSPSSSLLKPPSQREYPARTKRMFNWICFFWFLGWGNNTKVMQLQKGNHWLWYATLMWKPTKITETGSCTATPVTTVPQLCMHKTGLEATF